MSRRTATKKPSPVRQHDASCFLPLVYRFGEKYPDNEFVRNVGLQIIHGLRLTTDQFEGLYRALHFLPRGTSVGSVEFITRAVVAEVARMKERDEEGRLIDANVRALGLDRQTAYEAERADYLVRWAQAQRAVTEGEVEE